MLYIYTCEAYQAVAVIVFNDVEPHLKKYKHNQRYMHVHSYMSKPIGVPIEVLFIFLQIKVFFFLQVL